MLKIICLVRLGIQQYYRPVFDSLGVSYDNEHKVAIIKAKPDHEFPHQSS